MLCQFSNEFRYLFDEAAVDIWKAGSWTGYYLQNGEATPQKFVLKFHGDSFEGLGQDKLGFFLVLGSIDRRRSAARWVKQYIGAHAVDYEGALSGGRLVGRWTIQPHGLSDGFAVWPCTEDDD
jgi:hypothetical protein